MEGRSASNCRRNGVNPAISAKGTTPDKRKLNNYYYFMKTAVKACFAIAYGIAKKVKWK